MAVNDPQAARMLDVTGLSEEAIRAVESLVVLLRGHGAATGSISPDVPDPKSFEQGLGELLDGLPALTSLPADSSRADVYGEHR